MLTLHLKKPSIDTKSKQKHSKQSESQDDTCDSSDVDLMESTGYSQLYDGDDEGVMISRQKHR